MRGSTPFDHLLAIALACSLAACDVGAVEPSAGGGPDAGPAGAGPAGGGPDAGGPANPVACDDPVATGEDGEHNAGQPCLDCHGPGRPGPDFQLAGTVYSSLSGGAPVVGATIRVIDASGAERTAISAQNGNFWIEGGGAIAFPVEVSASACPSTQPMVAPSATGNCNAGGCHDADFRIHLP